MNLKTKKSFLITLTIILVTSLSLAAMVPSIFGASHENTTTLTPDKYELTYNEGLEADGFNRIVVFMAAGAYNTPTGTPEELSDWFHMTIMGRNEAELEMEKNRAANYFTIQFGEGPDGDWDPMPFGVEPKAEYRAYSITGFEIPPEGWVVRDGGFMSVIPDVADGGMMLHGVYGGVEGKFVPAGSFIVFGQYNIAITSKDTADITPMIIHYESTHPIIPDPINEGMAFLCKTIAPWGEGTAQGIAYDFVNAVGWTQANIRNIHSYPPYGPSIVHDLPGKAIKEQTSFDAALSGSNEVPPVDTAAQGQATFELEKGNMMLSYKLTVSYIENVTQAHIHLGGPDENGPVVIFLYGPELISGSFNGVLAEGKLSAADLIGPMESQSLNDLLDEMRSGNTYVNVHTTQNPAGEIRGQIK
jgi:hypothetical protein